jgi:hypothetical protein
VLIEDYNGSGGENAYGVDLLPASVVGSFIHLATSPVAVKMTTVDKIQRVMLGNPDAVKMLGKTSGDPRVVGDKIVQGFEHGALIYEGKTGHTTWYGGMTMDEAVAEAAKGQPAAGSTCRRRSSRPTSTGRWPS